MRVPAIVRWPGTVDPGVIYNEMMSQEDWLPTLLAAAGVPGIVDECKKGCRANGKQWKVHLDGHDFGPFFKGEVEKGPRDSIYYFGQGGELNAVRWNDWKVHFATIEGNIATGTRLPTNWPLIVNLREDPYEKMPHEAEMGYMRWYADNMWLFVPIQQKIGEFLGTIPQYPFQEGASLSAAGIDYRSLKAYKAMQLLDQLTKQGGVGH
jgi:arylsulfatase